MKPKYEPIDYKFRGICDEKGCKVKVDQSLVFKCGGRHKDIGCQGHFCWDHQHWDDRAQTNICRECKDNWQEEDYSEVYEQAAREMMR